MTRRRFSFRVLALALTFGVAALPTPAFASGFQLFEQNGSGLGNAYAGQAAGIKDASAIHFNAAALTRTKGWSLVVSVETIGLSNKFSDTGSTVPSVTFPPPTGQYSFPVPLGNEGDDAGGWIPVPNGYLSGQVTERIWLGVGMNVPFGLETDWDPAWMGRFHATKSKVEARTVTPTVAIQLSDTLSIGGGASWQDLDADFNSGVAYGGLAYAGTAQAVAAYPPALRAAALAAVIAQLGPEGRSLEGAGLISGESQAWGWNAGALLKLGEQAHLGVSYRSKITHDIEGDVTFEGAPTFALPGALAPIGDALNSRFASGPVKTTIKLPETWSVAAAWENDKVEVLADWTWTGWSTLPTLDIVREDGSALSSVPLRFEDTWRVGLGLNYRMNDAWKLRLGTAYDKTPVKDEFRTPRLPDTDRIWAAGGFEWKVSEKARVDVGYTHIFIDEGISDLDNLSATGTPVGALVGTYNSKTDILGAQLTLSF
ncbi:MAG TPA: outer membrane protein transport protein [Vicinamibacteria bacterium]|nr:outer membrane protein transport protein [Vicinamibacteria bacterium]